VVVNVAETGALAFFSINCLRLDDDHRQIRQAELLRHMHFGDFGNGAETCTAAIAAAISAPPANFFHMIASLLFY